MPMAGDGEQVFIIDDLKKKVVVYNPKNDNMQIILVHGKEVCIHGTISYVERLILPKEYYWTRKRHKKFGQGFEKLHYKPSF